MKKAKDDGLRAKAERYRDLADDECVFANGMLREAAVKAFEEKNAVAAYFHENAAYVTGLVVMRLEAARDGRPTFPLRTFDAETLARLLTGETEAEYEERDFDHGLSDEAIVKGWESKTLIRGGYVTMARTPSSEQQETLFAALREYARAAAIAAKRIGSASLLDWAAIIDLLENRTCERDAPFKQDDALRLIALEKSAADRLRLDRIISELPSRPAPRGKVK